MTKNITFTLPAEAVKGASEAFLLGDFNNWNPENALQLEKQKDGSFKTVAKLEEGKTYEYRFLLNDGRWVNDYNAQSYTNVQGLHIDNCVITVPVSKKEDSQKEQSPKKAVAPKEVKAKVEKKAPATAKPASKATAKTAVVKPAKKAATKAPAVKAEKSAKPAVKKAAPKAKK